MLMAIVLTFAWVSSPATGFAQTAAERAKQVEQLSADATKAYRAGEYQKAADLFQKAHDIEPVPNLLFNMAKSYEKMENWNSAIEFYQKFLVEEGISKSARQSALERVDELKQLQAANKDASGEQTVVKTDQTEEPVKASPETEESGNTGAWIAMGTGAALLVGGGVFGIIASGKQSEFEDATTTQAKIDARDSGQTMALIADVMYISGAVIGGIGIYLLLTADSSEADSTATAFPWVGKDAAGVGMRTTF